MSPPSRPGRRLNERTMAVEAAAADFTQLVMNFHEQRDLTDVEMCHLLDRELWRLLRRLLRTERHPGNPGRKADEE